MSLLQANKAFCAAPTNLDNSLAEWLLLLESSSTSMKCSSFQFIIQKGFNTVLP